MTSKLTFGLIPVKDKKLSDIGLEMNILEISTVYPDGEMDILAIGQNVFELIEFQEKISDKLYPGGKVNELREINDVDLILLEKVIINVKRLYKSMNIKVDLPEINSDFSIYDIAHKVGFNTSQEIDLLGIRSEVERLKYTLDHLDTLIPVVTQTDELRNKIKMNGHIKNTLPPDFTI